MGTPRAEAIGMRTVLAALLVLASTTAYADHSSGGGHSGGALSHVSSGLASASSSSSSSPSSSSSSAGVICLHPAYVYGERPGPDVEAQPQESSTPSPVHFTGYIGMQKVHDSNFSTTLELAAENPRVRFGVQLTAFDEEQGSGQPDLHLYMPAATLGLGLGGGAYLEGGVVGAKTTNDPVMNTSLLGGVVGVRLDRQVAARTTLIGSAQVMMFESDVRAAALAAGVRVGPLQATFRVVDFNVGPALWGPEVGFGF